MLFNENILLFYPSRKKDNAWYLVYYWISGPRKDYQCTVFNLNHDSIFKSFLSEGAEEVINYTRRSGQTFDISFIDSLCPRISISRLLQYFMYYSILIVLNMYSFACVMFYQKLRTDSVVICVANSVQWSNKVFTLNSHGKYQHLKTLFR